MGFCRTRCGDGSHSADCRFHRLAGFTIAVTVPASAIVAVG